jgi:hypothetical protein
MEPSPNIASSEELGIFSDGRFDALQRIRYAVQLDLHSLEVLIKFCNFLGDLDTLRLVVSAEFALDCESNEVGEALVWCGLGLDGIYPLLFLCSVDDKVDLVSFAH